jgi:Domain of unknown function (DUF4350)
LPIGIASSDRKLLLAGAALLVLLLAASAVLSPPPEQISSPVPSTYSTQSAGAAAAYRLLSKLHYPVRRWESPPNELDADSHDILLILAEPSQPPSENERKALVQFVEEGGHVLFTGPGIPAYFPGGSVSQEHPDPSWESFEPRLPSPLTRGVQHITIQPQAYWGTLTADQLPLYGDSDSPVVISWALGDGEILWWAGSTPLTNAGITREDNLKLFLNSVANWSADESYKIYWDEYFHGQRSSLWSYVGKTSLAWSVLQLALLAAAVLFTFSRRSGPIFVPKEVSRLSPLEFVETLGGLYERAGAASSAIDVSYVRLRSLLTRQLSLPSNLGNLELAQAAERRLGWKDSGLAECLRQAYAASRDTAISSREALRIVKKLEQFAARLDLRSQIHRERN